MAGAVRLGDLCSGHEDLNEPEIDPEEGSEEELEEGSEEDSEESPSGFFEGRSNIQGSPDVYINDLPAHRQGDAWDIHCSGGSCHGGIAIGGSSTVIVNGQPLCRIGDSVDCGSTIVTGSSNVVVDES